MISCAYRCVTVGVRHVKFWYTQEEKGAQMVLQVVQLNCIYYISATSLDVKFKFIVLRGVLQFLVINVITRK